jgi:hypothetical protein
MILRAIRRRRAFKRACALLASGALTDAWPHVRQLWLLADAVYRGPIRYGAIIKPEFAVMVRVAELGLLRAEPFLRETLGHASPTVVAYAVETLNLLGAPIDRSQISSRVLATQVHWALGSFESTNAVEELIQWGAENGHSSRLKTDPKPS